MGEAGERFGDGLGDEQAIERVAVVGGYMKLTRRRGTSSTFDLEPFFRKIPLMPMTRSQDEAAIASRMGAQESRHEINLGL